MKYAISAINCQELYISAKDRAGYRHITKERQKETDIEAYRGKLTRIADYRKIQ